jgi:thiol-disulfide isomerase/thioredoxin
MRKHFLLIFIGYFSGCTPDQKSPELSPGFWRGVFQMQDQEMPFNFELFKTGGKYAINLVNGEEKILVDDVTVRNDSLMATMHIFDSEIRAKIINDGQRLSGVFVKNYLRNYELPFSAEVNSGFRFEPISEVSQYDLNGRYAVSFVPDKNGEPYQAIGEFESYGNDLSGTFLTPTGDYRYLQGNLINDQVFLSAFDGNHAFLFKAQLKEDSLINGEFWSGPAWHEQWAGVKNQEAVLPDPHTLTYLKPGYDKITFSFPGLDGDTVRLEDEKYKDKVVILQIFGTWCPNCMDETRFLAEWYRNNQNQPVEIIGLAYEQKADFQYARERVNVMIEKLNVPYDFVIAGTSNKKEASKTLPMLNHIMSFPTMIILDKEGNVERIHTGFSGPGTGIHYEQFVESFNELMKELLS